MDLLLNCLAQLRNYPGLESLHNVQLIEPHVVHITPDNITFVWTWKAPKLNIPSDYEYSATVHLEIIFFVNNKESVWIISNDFCSNLIVPQERIFESLPWMTGSMDENAMRSLFSAISKDLPFVQRNVRNSW